MSDKGHCYDNAVAKSFFHKLKTEEVHLKHYRTKEEAKAAIFEHVEVFYNQERLHSTLGYRSPKEFEEIWEKQLIEQIYVMFQNTSFLDFSVINMLICAITHAVLPAENYMA